MLIITSDNIPGRNIQVLGLVKGNVVQSKNIGRDIMAGLKTIAGGEIKSYTQMLAEAREIATSRMIQEAQALGADAIISMRFAGSPVMDGAADIIAYGTAVKML